MNPPNEAPPLVVHPRSLAPESHGDAPLDHEWSTQWTVNLPIHEQGPDGEIVEVTTRGFAVCSRQGRRLRWLSRGDRLLAWWETTLGRPLAVAIVGDA